MKHFKLGLSRLAVPMAILGAMSSAQAQKSAVLKLTQTGADVVMTASGSLDLSSLNLLTSNAWWNVQGFVHQGVVGMGPLGSVSNPVADAWDGFTWDASSSDIFNVTTLSPGTNTNSFSGLGLSFANFGSTAVPSYTMFVDDGYVSGSTLSGNAIFSGHSIASMGLNTGTYRWTYGSSNQHEFKIVVDPASGGTTGGGGGVPEPGEWAAMGVLGAGLTGLVIRKRRQA